MTDFAVLKKKEKFNGQLFPKTVKYVTQECFC